MQSIKVGDKTYSFSWGMLTFLNTSDALGISLEDLHEKIAMNDAKCWYKLAYQALLSHDELFNDSKETFNGSLDGFSFSQFVHWLNEQEQKVGDDISESYRKSIYMGRTMEDRYAEILAKLSVDLGDTIETDNVKPVKKKKEALAK